jgi:superfamily II DNA or RNA helicase
MSFKDLNIKPCYESGIDDIIEDFYVPVLSESVQYDRIAGFFSSSALAIASRGLHDFIIHQGKMRIITSPILNSDDAAIIERITNAPDSIELEDLGVYVDNIEDEFESNHVKALGWMLYNGLLEMKLAIVKNENGEISPASELMGNGLFHQKVGVLTDGDGNKLSFSGSINESASAWVYNDEEFKVFKDWTDSSDYYLRDKKRFEEIWYGQRNNIKVFNLPDAIKNKLIQYSRNFDIESISINHYHKKKQSLAKNKDISLFYYQEDALAKWKNNSYRLLFEMATGTGKTRTAIAGIARVKKSVNKTLTIISTPQNTLSAQWKYELDKFNLGFDESAIIDGTIPQWQTVLSKILLNNAIGLADHVVIFTTHTTASSNKFISTIQSDLSQDTLAIFVGDEVHWLGARNNRKALLQLYKYRIGLSATPTRWFDDEGTQVLLDYFGNSNYEFTIHDALTKTNPLTGKHFLVNYFYHISSVPLNQDETLEYKKVSSQLLRLQSRIKTEADAQEKYDRLLERRANILKNADAKYEELERILDVIEKKNGLSNLIIFVSPEQLERVMKILFNRNIIFHKLTESEGTKKERKYGGISEREYIIKAFKSNQYKALVAIKCLDEGIDIPSASTGILMASSTNPREYVQRIGRIIRQDEGKTFANLYDICIDKIHGLEGEEIELERRVKKKEAIRLTEIAENAINSADALKVIMNLKY